MTSETDPIGRDVGRSRSRRRLPDGAACVLCGESDPEVLGNRASGSVLEVHHLAGRVNDPDLTVVLCLNCHRRMSARMPAYGVELQASEAPSSETGRVIGLLRGLAVFFELLAVALMRWAERLSLEVAV